MDEHAETFYITGGTLLADAPSYVERRADKELLEGLARGDFCYVLTSRQMGKSSLMVRTAIRLRAEGMNVVALDLTAIGQNLTPEQWYDGLITRMGRQLNLEEELEEFWRNSKRLSPIQRLFAAIRDVTLPKRPGRLTIFVDEIDSVKSLPFSTDEFFAAIRECYNRRSEDPEFHRLTFCLLGVAIPSDLIRDTRTTPFNIGRRIELDDFSAQEARPLARGLLGGVPGKGAGKASPEAEEAIAAKLLERVLFWTGGHPYLTQQLCGKVAAANSGSTGQTPRIHRPEEVDALCGELFLSPRASEKDDNLLFVRERMLRTEVDRAGLLELYAKIHRQGHALIRRCIADDETNPLVSILRLAGITRATAGCLRVRNRIYERVFDRAWVRKNMPDAEVRRQRQAFIKGLARGAAIAAVVVGAALWSYQRAQEQRMAAHGRIAVQNFGRVYQSIGSYADRSSVQQNIEMAGAQVETHGTIRFAFERPKKLRFSGKMQMGLGETEVQVISDGHRIWTYLPKLKTYTEAPAPRSVEELILSAGSHQGMNFAGSAYLLLSDRTRHRPPRDPFVLQYLREEKLDGKTVDVLAWEQTPPPTLFPGPLSRSNRMTLPATVWVDQSQGYVQKIAIDFSRLVTNGIFGAAAPGVPRFPLQGLKTTAVHQDIQLNPKFAPGTFSFEPPPGVQRVKEFDWSKMFMPSAPQPSSTPRFTSEQLHEAIPPRDSSTPDSCVDLSAVYNAPLTRPWHSGRGGNDLTELPRGVQSVAGVTFDIRGLVQLAGKADPVMSSYPNWVIAIGVGKACRRLHILHGAGWASREGSLVARFVVHYPDGQQRIIPVFYGFDVRDWWAQPDEPQIDNGLSPAWKGSNPAARADRTFIRLYKITWDNPRPDQEIAALDFISALDQSAPFLIAVTAE